MQQSEQVRTVWRQHYETIKAVPRSCAVRRAIGLAMMSEEADWEVAGPRTFVADSKISWLMAVDLPPGAVEGKKHFMTWACKTKTRFYSGMPCLRSTAPGFDLRWNTPPANFAFPEVAHAVNLIMSLAAGRARDEWREIRGELLNLVPESALDAEIAEQISTMPAPRQWLPRAYLAIPLKWMDRMWEQNFHPADFAIGREGLPPRKASPYYTENVRRLFTGDFAAGLQFRCPFMGGAQVIKAGDNFVELTTGTVSVRIWLPDYMEINVKDGQGVPCGHLLASYLGRNVVPEHWSSLTPARRWLHLERFFEGSTGSDGEDGIDGILKSWFENQLVYDLVPGFVHAPTDLFSPAARDLAVDGEFRWELGEWTTPYWSADCSAFIFPPIPRQSWQQFSGFFGAVDEVAYDVTPRIGGLRAQRERESCRAAAPEYALS